MEKRSLEDFTCEKIIITANKETKDLRSEGQIYRTSSLLAGPASVFFFYGVDYPLASTKSYVFLGLGVLTGGYSIFSFLFGTYLSRKASRLEQKIFEEEREQANHAQENHYRR